MADVQTVVSSGISGRNVAENIEGRERYQINVRYEQDFRDSVDRMRTVLIGTPSGSQIPLGQVARTAFLNGPAMIRDEDGQLAGYIYINVKDTNYGALSMRQIDCCVIELYCLRTIHSRGQENTSFKRELNSG